MTTILERGSPSFLISSVSCFSLSSRHDHDLIKHVDDFCKTHPHFNPVFVVSLSGGVDSMVLVTIIKGLGYRVVCIHINYNNRLESSDEACFIHEWTQKNEIELIFKEIDMKRGDCDPGIRENA